MSPVAMLLTIQGVFCGEEFQLPVSRNDRKYSYIAIFPKILIQIKHGKG